LVAERRVHLQPLLPPLMALGNDRFICSSQKKEIPRLSKQERVSEKIMSAKLFSRRELNLKQKWGNIASETRTQEPHEQTQKRFPGATRQTDEELQRRTETDLSWRGGLEATRQGPRLAVLDRHPPGGEGGLAGVLGDLQGLRERGPGGAPGPADDVLAPNPSSRRLETERESSRASGDTRGRARQRRLRVPTENPRGRARGRCAG
jgi:hypothetical protein